jgi:predicted acyl esterase
MPITLADFERRASDVVAEQSVGFDPERPFLFEGLKPRFATRVVRSVFMPMRDGVRLSTDFHIPVGAPGPLPVILSRTPYGKRTSSPALTHLFPEQGFIHAVQDIRGRYESEGEFVACSAIERDDGYDTVSWLAAQPWCNGAVGAIGSSYVGETAAKLAATRHPNHRASIIMFDGAYAGGLNLNGGYLQNGAVMLRMLYAWFRDYVPKISFGPPSHVEREAWFASPCRRVCTRAPMPWKSKPRTSATRAALQTIPHRGLLFRGCRRPVRSI